MWTVWDTAEGRGFERYRVLEARGNQYTVEHESNGGGTLTTAYIIGFSVERREIRKDGQPTSIRVLRVSSLREGQWSDPVFGR